MRQLPHRRRHRRLRAQTRHKMLDLALALVSSVVQDLKMVDGRQVRGQQGHRGEGHRPVGQQIQNNWELAGCSRRLDPAIRSVLGEVQHLRAVGEERGAAFGQIQPARVELGERRETSSAVERRSCAASACTRASRSWSVKAVNVAIVIIPLVTSSFSGRQNGQQRDRWRTRRRCLLRGRCRNPGRSAAFTRKSAECSGSPPA